MKLISSRRCLAILISHPGRSGPAQQRDRSPAVTGEQLSGRPAAACRGRSSRRSTLRIVPVDPSLPATTTLPNLPAVRPATAEVAGVNPAAAFRRNSLPWIARERRQDAGRDPLGKPPLVGTSGSVHRVRPRQRRDSRSMSSKGNQRRDQRRRLVVSWNRSASAAGAAAAAEPRAMAEYSREAHPEHQRSPAVLLPTSIGGMTLAIAAILLPVAGAVIAAAWEPIMDRPLFVRGGRFAGTIGALQACFDPRSMQSLAGWLTQLMLLLAAAVALVVRLMRRYRRDDYKGRFRAWGWLAGLFIVTACATNVPLGRVVGMAIVDVSGMAFGPAGLGWWVAVAVVAYGVVSPWAVLPLHERTATSFWLVLALASWGGSAACSWLAAGRDRLVIAAQASWALGAALAAVAMLAAARSVIREVRGQCTPHATKAERRTPERGAATPVVEESVADEEPDSNAVASDAAGDDEAGFVDGSEQEHRHLSKAERKRLKKLARMNRTAA